MSDIYSILSSSYASVSLSTPSNTPYTNVDPASYEGTWSGTYSNNTKFQFTMSQVNGFRAQVKYQSGATVQYQSVLIKDGSFRIGDSKFTLGSTAGTATAKTVITSAVDGSTTLVQGSAALDG